MFYICLESLKTVEQWFRNVGHICFYIFFLCPSGNNPSIPENVQFVQLKLWGKSETLWINLYEHCCTFLSGNAWMERSVKKTLSFFLLGEFSGLACGATVENNHKPCSEGTGLACINIDGNLACFLCLQCFREFYCSLLRQYVWLGRPVCSLNKEQQWTALPLHEERGCLMLAPALACSDTACKLVLNVCKCVPLKAKCRRLHVFSVIPWPSSRLAALHVSAGMLRGRQAVLMCVAGWLFTSSYVGGVRLTALSHNKLPSEHQILRLILLRLLQASTLVVLERLEKFSTVWRGGSVNSVRVRLKTCQQNWFVALKISGFLASLFHCWFLLHLVYCYV